jgi:7-cyano-7-deazaguanine synthase in queuosine biosynthesis
MEIDIPFDKSWKSIAISSSGGADSTLLAYLLCDMIEQADVPITVHMISHTRLWKTRPWQSYDSLRIYNWLVSKFSKITFVRHTNFIPPEFEHGYSKQVLIVDEYDRTVSGDTVELRSFAEYVCFQNDVDAYFNGVTKNPPIDFGGMTARDVDPTEHNQHLVKTIHMGKLACHPFRFADKSRIVLKYKELGLQSLFDITRSCEGEFENLNYQNYTPGQYVPICGKCFWCKERAWAIEQSK